MKTTKNISLNAKMSFAAAALFVFSTLGNINATESGNKAILKNLDQINSRMLEVIKYKAPAEPEANTYMVSDYEVAEKRLEELHQVMEQSIRFKASEVAEDIEEYEVQAALEHLDTLTLALEESIKF